MATITQKITPFLWFDTHAEEAANFYVSVFKNSKVVSTMPGPNGSIMGVSFILDGVHFQALNGGPMFKFTEAISLFVHCENQAEVDHFWNTLTADGGQESMCGWLKDKYGLSWQIIPTILSELFAHKDREKANHAMQAMLKMKKINIAKLQEAFNG